MAVDVIFGFTVTMNENPAARNPKIENFALKTVNNEQLTEVKLMTSPYPETD